MMDDEDDTPTRPETPMAFRAISSYEELVALVNYLDAEDLAFILRVAKPRLRQSEIENLLNKARENFLEG